MRLPSKLTKVIKFWKFTHAEIQRRKQSYFCVAQINSFLRAEGRLFSQVVQKESQLTRKCFIHKTAIHTKRFPKDSPPKVI